jgi:uroporphyrinogen-III synthase
MRILVTRPAAQAVGWVQTLRACGADAAALPLIGIEAVADTTPLVQAWRTLAGHRLVMFVSANAVGHFFAAGAGVPWPAGVHAGATGPGTATALRAAGVPEAAIVAPDPARGRFDTEALWRQHLAAWAWPGQTVLVVRGEDGRDWLAEQLRAAGAVVQFVAAYRRVVPAWGAAEQALAAAALAAPASHLWSFSSSEAVQHLRRMLPMADFAPCRAAASHERIVQVARAAGFGQVLLVAPDAAALASAAAGAARGAP